MPCAVPNGLLRRVTRLDKSLLCGIHSVLSNMSLSNEEIHNKYLGHYRYMLYNFSFRRMYANVFSTSCAFLLSSNLAST